MVAIVAAGSILLATVVVGLLVFVGLIGPFSRRSEAVQREAAYAQARVDFLTQLALQEMRDAVRLEFRSQGGRQE